MPTFVSSHRLRVICVAVLTVVCGMSRADFYDSSALDVLQTVVDDRADGWYCRWQVQLPDRVPGSSDAREVIGRSGISRLSVRDMYFAETPDIASQLIVIEDFMGGYSVPVHVATDNQVIRNQPFNIYPFENPNGLSGVLYNAPAPRPESDAYNYYVDYTGLNAVRKDSYVYTATSLTCANDEVCLETDNNPNGTLLLCDWNGGAAVNNGAIGGSLILAKNVTFHFFRATSDRIARASISGQRNGETFGRQYIFHLSDGTDGCNATGLYGETVNQLAGDVYNFNNTDYSVSTSAVNLQITDADAAFGHSHAGLMNLTPLRANVSSRYNKCFSFSINDGYFYYEDFAVVTPDDFGKMPYPADNYDEAQLQTFYDAFCSTDFAAVRGTVTACQPVNAFWDRDGGTVPVPYHNVKFDTHYLAPIRYLYAYPTDYLWSYVAGYAADAIKIDELSFDVDDEPATRSDALFDFELTSYDNGAFVENTPDKYLGIGGTLTTNVDNAEFFVVADEIRADYASPLLDATTGHINATSLTPYVVADNTAATTVSDTRDIAFLIPQNSIAGPEKGKDKFTLFAKYNDASGNTRFRSLYVIDENTISGKNDVKLSALSQRYQLRGNTLRATDATVDIFDVTGRLHASVQPGGAHDLTSGIYVVKVNTETFKIIVR